MNLREYYQLSTCDIPTLDITAEVSSILSRLLESTEQLRFDIQYQIVKDPCKYYFKLGLGEMDEQYTGSLSTGMPMVPRNLKMALEAVRLVEFDRGRRQRNYDRRLAELEQRVNEIAAAQADMCQMMSTSNQIAQLSELAQLAEAMGGKIATRDGQYDYERPLIRVAPDDEGNTVLFRTTNAHDPKRHHHWRHWYYEEYELNILGEALAHDWKIYSAAFPEQSVPGQTKLICKNSPD